MIFFDTETCGFHGPTVLIQWAEDGGPIQLHNVWYSPIEETLELIETLCYHDEGVCGFNLAFDWFHICQTYTVLQEMVKQGVDPREHPIDHILEYADAEPAARDGKCLKPMNCLDLWLHARQGPYQTTMERSDIKISKVPTALAYILVAELGERVELDDIYFQNFSDKRRRWKAYDITDDMGNIDPNFKDVCLIFRPSSSLKALAFDALGLDEKFIYKFTDVEMSESHKPKEYGYAPYALAVGDRKNWNGAWPLHIRAHAQHWEYNDLARQYAEDDVSYTRGLAYYFDRVAAGDSKEEAREYANGDPSGKRLEHLEISDYNSELACMTAAVRWRGYKFDVDKIRSLRDGYIEKRSNAKYNFSSPDVCIKYLEEVMDETEKLSIRVNGSITTKKIVLEEIQRWKKQDICPNCEGMGCDQCEDGLVIVDDSPHPAAERAKEIADYRQMGNRINTLDKLIRAGRFHAAFKVVGTLSDRMSGDGGLNAQGIPHEKEIRSAFQLAWDGMILTGGDFDGFEVTIADAVYGDPELRGMLKSGMKIHGIFGTYLFPPMTYEEILKTDGLPGAQDKYGRSKNGVFALIYGGEAYTLSTRVGVPEDVAAEAYGNFASKFIVWGQKRQEIFDKFCSMRQPGGTGTKVIWADPHDYAESMQGFRRYFTIENQIVKALFDLANSPPKHLSDVKIKVTRRDREQTAAGAVRSALFGAAFKVQAANMRAAANHEIQSTGAGMTKRLQCRLWTLQPKGISEWHIMPMNIHDEVMAPVKDKETADKTEEIVNQFVEYSKAMVPLVGITWNKEMGNWASKKG